MAECGPHHGHTIRNMYVNQLPGLFPEVKESIENCTLCAKEGFPEHIYGHRLEEIRDGLAPDFDENGHLRHCNQCRLLAGMTPLA